MWRKLVVGLTVAAVLAACGGGSADDTVEDTAAGAADGSADGAAPAPVDAELHAGTEEAGRDADDAATSIEEPAAAESSATRTPLRAGSVDDNVDFADYLDYRTRFLATGLAVHDLDVTERHLVTVSTPDGRPVLGATVTLRAGTTELAQVRTTADGTARILPLAVGATTDDTLEIDVAHGEAQLTQPLARSSGVVPVTLDTTVVGEPVPLDVLLLLDTTGSMGDELDRLTATFADVARRIATLGTATDLRFAFTAYRDLADAYVTRTFDFTPDVDRFVDELARLEADGGDDEPEALSEALEEALSLPAWRGGDTVSLVFLVADAPPQLDRDADYAVEVLRAAARGIKIVPLASSGLNDQGEYVFRQLAQITGGPFLFLTYGADGAPGDDTPHDVSGYDVLSLDELIVRVVENELAALTGEPVRPPQQ